MEGEHQAIEIRASLPAASETQTDEVVNEANSVTQGDNPSVGPAATQATTSTNASVVTNEGTTSNAVDGEPVLKEESSNESGCQCQRKWLIIASIAQLLLVAVGATLGAVLSSSSSKSSSARATGSGGAFGQNIAGFNGLKVLHYTVSTSVDSADSSCDTSNQEYPSFSVTCSRGAILLSPTNGDCRLVTDTTIECVANLRDSLEVKCYGDNEPEMQLEVNLHEDGTSYYCNGWLRAKEGSNSVGYWEEYFYGGSVTHQVSIFGRNCQVESEFVDAVIVAEDQSLSSCEDSKFCALFWDGSIGCTGVKYCYASAESKSFVIPMNANVSHGCMEDFVLDAPLGSTCKHNVECESNVCIMDQCVADKLEHGYEGCEEDLDCESGECAALSADDPLTATCCASGKSSKSSFGQYVCTGQETGASCFNDELCSSEVCLFGVCVEGKQAEGGFCESDSHCESGGCGILDQDHLKVCCPSSSTVLIDDKTYCSGLANNYQCSVHDACAGGACGFETFETFADKICCPSGGSVLLIHDPWSLDFGEYCDGLPALTSCGSDALCAVGSTGGSACGILNYTLASISEGNVCCPTGFKINVYDGPDGAYVNKDFCASLPEGYICSGNDMCASGVCIDGICANRKVDNLGRCDDGGDCTSGACGFEFYSMDATKVCCPSGGSVLLTTNPLGNFVYEEYCDGLPALTSCGSDTSCAVGSTGGSACGILNYTLASISEGNVCCPTGFKIYVDYFPDGAFVFKDFCASLPEGYICSGNDMCASGVCIDNACVSGKRSDLDYCDDGGDCTSGACGFEFYSMDATKVCCPSGGTVRITYNPEGDYDPGQYCDDLSALTQCGSDASCAVGSAGTSACGIQNYTLGSIAEGYVCCPTGKKLDVNYGPDGTYINKYFCSSLPEGSICSGNDMCSSEVCIDGLCANGLKAASERCDDVLDCVNGACGFEEFLTSATKVCCPNGKIVRRIYDPEGDYNPDYYCDNE